MRTMARDLLTLMILATVPLHGACGQNEPDILVGIDDAQRKGDVAALKRHLGSKAQRVKAWALRALIRLGKEAGYKAVSAFLSKASRPWRMEVLVTLFEKRSLKSKGWLKLSSGPKTSWSPRLQSRVLHGS